jgi:glycine/D-amino acid oxidase-like deaminating enzyme
MVRSKVDFLIVGQGIAGTLLAWRLLRLGASVIVIDDNHTGAASLVAAGIINPITGKRMVPTWEFNRFYPEAHNTYRQLESDLGAQYFKEMSIIRLIQSNAEDIRFNSRRDRPDFKQYLKTVNKPGLKPEIIKDPLGSFTLSPAAYVNIPSLVIDLGKYLDKKKSRLTCRFHYDDLKLESDKVIWKDWIAKRIIFCEGFRGCENPWFNSLPFKPTKGEVLTLETDTPLLPRTILNCGKWLLPTSEYHCLAGATFSWDPLNNEPSERGKNEILNGLRSFTHLNFKVLNHVAGIRPTMENSRPVIEQHSRFPALVIFNGLGTKGALIAPLCTRILADNLRQMINFGKNMCITYE